MPVSSKRRLEALEERTASRAVGMRPGAMLFLLERAVESGAPLMRTEPFASAWAAYLAAVEQTRQTAGPPPSWYLRGEPEDTRRCLWPRWNHPALNDVILRLLDAVQEVREAALRQGG